MLQSQFKRFSGVEKVLQFQTNSYVTFGQRLIGLPSPEEGSHISQITKQAPNGKTATVTIVPTTHRSAIALGEAIQIIKTKKPKAVFLDICESRRYMIDPALQPPQLTLLERFSFGNLFVIMYSGLCRFVLGKPPIEPNTDYKTIVQEAEKVKAKIYLGDRDFKITQSRLNQMGGLTQYFRWIGTFGTIIYTSLVAKAACRIAGQNFYETLDPKFARFVMDRSLYFQQAAQTSFVVERDQYMAFKLREVAFRHGKVIAFMGAVHVDGVKHYWEGADQVNVDDLNNTIIKKSIFQIFLNFFIVGILIDRVVRLWTKPKQVEQLDEEQIQQQIEQSIILSGFVKLRNMLFQQEQQTENQN
eukprot:TRINITY_DN4761_c0_g1_i1.p1 TRINITY_DN4761_c0_g1~~TRINITY_DN4761_c0_g1_i1.p1  ORF type:complete len:358 (-),score=27.22 TRINITY_DN4761_c0_g1_i1:158-1231(-)